MTEEDDIKRLTAYIDAFEEELDGERFSMVLNVLANILYDGCEGQEFTREDALKGFIEVYKAVVKDFADPT